MAKPKTLSWTKLSIWPGDGMSPEDFTSAVCGLTTKSFTLSADTSDITVPDCDDPDQPAWVERIVRSLSGGFNGSGLMAEDIYETWRDWTLSGLAKNCRIVIDGTTLDGYYEGSFILTSFETNGNQGDGKMQITVQLQSDGPITWNVGTP